MINFKKILLVVDCLIFPKMFDILKLLKLDNLFENLVGYIETKVDYYKIQFKEELARALAILIFIYCISLVLVLFLIFISFGAVVLINHLLSSQYLGFVIIACIYLVLAVIMYLYRDKFFFNKVFEAFFNKEEDNKES